MSLQEFLLLYLISNAVGLLLIYVCYRWFKAGRIVFSLIFLAAGIFNFYTAGKSPDVYVEAYGDSAWFSFYKDFIYGFFSQHVTLLVRIIAAGQIIIGIFLLLRGVLFMLGILGGIIFLLAIAPLGIGSAFPCTIFMAFGLYLLYRNKKKLKRNLTEIQG
jgi:hypothetical protein